MTGARHGDGRRVVVTGSIANDYIMSFPGRFSEHILPDKIDILSVSFLVDSLRREPGGTAANIAYNLALLGLRPTVMATVGADFEPDRRRLEARGVDTAQIRVVPDHFTASFFVSTDEANCQIASFYIGAMGAAADLTLDTVPDDEVALVVISPNAPEAMAKHVRECKARGLPFVYDPSQQIVRLTAEALVEGITGSLVFIANEYEFELVHEKTGLGVEDALDLTGTLVVTRGEHGSIIRSGGHVHLVPAVRPTTLVDPTGVGDAYRSGIVYGLLADLPWPVAGRVGSLAATYALEHTGTQAHDYDAAAFLARYEASFGDVPLALRRTLADQAALA